MAVYPAHNPSSVGTVRIRARVREGGTDVTVLLLHPMDTGLRRDDSGTLIPAYYITEVSITHSGRLVLESEMSIAVARDPLLSFRFEGGASGDPIEVQWKDNLGGAGIGTGVTT